MLSLISSRTLQVVIALFASTPALATTASPTDSVTTREAAVNIGGVTYQHVQFEGRDYFMKSARPGSALTEVNCQAPKPSSPTLAREGDLAVASRSREFVDRLRQGCEAKDGQVPERFTFEQPALSSKKASQEAKPRQKVELLGPNSFPPDVDPHILPEQLPAGGNFDWNQKRY